MREIDLGLLETVNEDLAFLFTKWNQDIDDASLRIYSPILRRLLVDHKLEQAARSLEMRLQIMTPLICATEPSKKENLQFYQCGGAKYKGVIVQSFEFYNKALDQKEISEHYNASKDILDKSYLVSISTFLKQTSFVIKEVTINREEVIKYVTNKLGGAHYDNERKIAGNAQTISLEYKYALMDNVRAQLILADKNAIYYELLSIGQRLVASRDVHKLRKQINSVKLQTLLKSINRPAKE